MAVAAAQQEQRRHGDGAHGCEHGSDLQTWRDEGSVHGSCIGIGHDGLERRR
jgi:hypothetical protein